MTEPSVPERLKAALADRYRIEKEIGSGGMATVYLAEDLKHDRQVAVKVLDPGLAETLGADRFLREIKTAANLTHPHILPVFDSGEAEGFLFYVMPYVEGESVRARLRKEKQLPVDDAIQITREIADALAYAHEKGVIHRDVKPANIMLEAGHAVLADFGVAHAVAEAKDERITRTGTSLGTPAYMSPEQAAGEQELDGRSDQYALACVLYEMLAGQPPFTGAQVESVVRQHLTAEPPDVTQLRSAVPDGVTKVLAKGLSKAPADRFATTTEFGNVLVALSQTPPAGIVAASRPRARVGWGARLLALGAGAVIVGLIWRPWGRGEIHTAATGPPPWTILAEVSGSAPEDLRRDVGDLLAGEIDASGTVQVLPEFQVQRGLAMAMLPDTTTLTPRVAREVGERAGIGLVFTPELDKVGETYVLTVPVLYAEGDSILDTRRFSARTVDELIQGSQSVVNDLRPVLAEWVGEGVRPPVIGGSATASMAAFRKTRQARTAMSRGQYDEAIALCWEALAIDPEYAGAWLWMAGTYGNAGFPDSARFARAEALKYPERLEDGRRLLTEARNAGDLIADLRIQERLYRETPTPTYAHRYAAALADITGRYEEAVEIYAEMVGQIPFGLNPLRSMNWATYLLALGRVDEARIAAENTLGTARELPMKARIAVRARDWGEAERIGLEVARDPAMSIRWQSEALWIVASARGAQGRLNDAVAALQEMVGANERPGREGGFRRSQLNLLLLYTVAELAPRPWRMEILHADTADRAVVVSGLWAAESGDRDAARSHLDALPGPGTGEFDLPTVQGSLLSALRARLSLLDEDPETAVRVLEAVTGERAPRAETSTRLPNWIRAEAEEELGRLEEAAELYAQIAGGYRFGDYEVAAFGLTYSFAHRRAALLYGQLGERDKAVEHWRAFLDAFTQPDPEFEWMVEEGRTALARLEA